jgi:two-component system phosphate regulon sensor histidine kinase PhoR
MAAQLADLQRRKLRRLMTLVAIFAYGPSALLITIGVLILVFGHATKDVVFGIMTLSLTVTLLGGVALTIVYVRRESSVAQLQTEFVNKVSHDLRTPLTSIRLFVETLQAKRLQDPEKIQQVLDIDGDRNQATVGDGRAAARLGAHGSRAAQLPLGR